jgi:hypothetical protein
MQVLSALPSAGLEREQTRAPHLPDSEQHAETVPVYGERIAASML